tara:strand:- start:36 stop:326 length:291 start_codon:yes stop_codon:yes gene_type:complete
MKKTVSVNILGRSKDFDLEEFTKMYTNEIKSLRYQLTLSHARSERRVLLPNGTTNWTKTVETIENIQKLEDKLNKAIRAVELCAKRLFDNQLTLSK